MNTKMLSSNAVRHRSSSNPPNDSRHPPTSLAMEADGGEDVGGGSNVSATNGKIHRRFRRRRDDLIRSKKCLYVVGGALSMMAMCLVGMWASSTSIDGGRVSRKIDHHAPSPNKMGRKKRPRGIGLRNEEDFFPIPESPEHAESMKVARNNDPLRLKPKDPLTHEAALAGKSRANKIGKIESQGSDSKRHKKLKSADEDRANEEDGHWPDDEKAKIESPSPSGLKPSNEVDTRSGGSHVRPRVLRLHFEKTLHQRSSGDKDTGEDDPVAHYASLLLTEAHRLSTYESKDLPSSDRYITPYPDDDKYFDRLENVKKSKKYRRNAREPLEDKECKPRHKWQTGAFPNCNILHEFELGQLSGMFGRAIRKKLRKNEGEGEELVKYLAHGYWRDVWLVSKASSSFNASHDALSDLGEEITVLKTLRHRHDFTDRNYDRHRKDALASERLSKSPNVVDIFAFCSNSAIYEYGPGGDIEGKLWPYDNEEEKYYVADIPSSVKIDIAYQVARGIADMHDVEDDGYASIAHTDITPSQFIFINGRWKMNDFNRCRFMRVYKQDNSPCGFYVGANPGKFRAPEEYKYEEENEMIDIYSMGNIFYAIIAGEMPFEGQKESKAQKKVMEGKRPIIPEEVLESDDIAIQVLVATTKKCWEQKPSNRLSAASIRDELKHVMDRIKMESDTT